VGGGSPDAGWTHRLLGDDGAYVQMTMFVADKYGDLSAGTLYTAKWDQPAIRTAVAPI
jgi:hypothetical protein